MHEANKAVAMTFLNALGRGDGEAMKSVMTDDFVAYTTGTSCALSGIHHSDGILAFVAAVPLICKAGIRFKVINLTAEDDRVACELEGYSTMKNGKEYNNFYHFLVFIRDGKVYRMNEYFDTKLTDDVLVPALAEIAGAMTKIAD